MTYDDLELELRRLRGVRSTGFAEREGHLHVQVHTTGEELEPNLGTNAMRIAYRHSDTPVALEIVRWRTLESGGGNTALAAPAEAAEDEETDEPAVLTGMPTEARSGPVMRERRIRLLATLVFPDTDELEVHLTFEGRRVIGRASASAGLLGAVSATLDGVQAFAPDLGAEPAGARIVDEQGPTSVILSEVSTETVRMLGVAQGTSPVEAAARATLHAINRTLALHLTGADAD
ncbi:MAG TPA: hypothetical protein VIC35_11615 [Acidimicrobiia bacterium]|jgi:hypothetical protein